MTLGRQLTTQTIIQLSGKLISVLLGLGVVMIMTRSLGLNGFGEYTTIIAFLQSFGILVDLGLTVTTGKLIGQSDVAEKKLLSNVFSLRVLTALVMFSLAPLAASYFPYPAIIKIGIFIAAWSFFAASVAQTFGAIFQKYLKTHWFVLAEIVGRVLLLLSVIWLAQRNDGLLMFILAVLVSSLINLLLVIIFARRISVFGWEIDWSVWKKIWRETWPVALTIALNLVYFKADTVILSLYKTAGEVGIYGASYKVLEILLAIPTIVGGLLLPLVTSLLIQQAWPLVRRYYQIGLDAMLMVGLAIVVGSLVMGKEVMIWLAGSNFSQAGEVLPVVALATAIIFLSNLCGYFILALGYQRSMIRYYLVAAVLSLLGYFIFIPYYSYWAAAWVTVIIEGFMAVASFWLVRQKLPLNLANWPKIILAVSLLGIFLIVLAPLMFWLKIIASIIFYYYILTWFKLIPRWYGREKII
jgi:O-antigen/teichoic acid export membrane protein